MEYLATHPNPLISPKNAFFKDGQQLQGSLLSGGRTGMEQIRRGKRVLPNMRVLPVRVTAP